MSEDAPVVFSGPQFTSDREKHLEKELAAARAALAEKTRQVEELCDALQLLHDDTTAILVINDIGRPENRKPIRLARKALAEARKGKV